MIVVTVVVDGAVGVLGLVGVRRVPVDLVAVVVLDAHEVGGAAAGLAEEREVRGPRHVGGGHEGADDADDPEAPCSRCAWPSR